eukprot:2676758-Rhodomonas_salina.2
MVPDGRSASRGNPRGRHDDADQKQYFSGRCEAYPEWVCSCCNTLCNAAVTRYANVLPQNAAVRVRCYHEVLCGAAYADTRTRRAPSFHHALLSCCHAPRSHPRDHQQLGSFTGLSAV